jgi:Flp pilus assembly pilin Flp
MTVVLRRLWHEQSGDDNVEYALLVAIIALVAVIALSQVGKSLRGSGNVNNHPTALETKSN